MNPPNSPKKCAQYFWLAGTKKNNIQKAQPNENLNTYSQ